MLTLGCLYFVAETRKFARVWQTHRAAKPKDEEIPDESKTDEKHEVSIYNSMITALS